MIQMYISIISICVYLYKFTYVYVYDISYIIIYMHITYQSLSNYHLILCVSMHVSFQVKKRNR